MRSKQRVSAQDVAAELATWRRKHGGRGRRIPPRFWELALELAAEDGIDETARALSLDKARLERLAQGGGAKSIVSDGPPHFVELSASEVLQPSAPVKLEVLGRDGERLLIHLASSTTEQLVSLVRAFAGRVS